VGVAGAAGPKAKAKSKAKAKTTAANKKAAQAAAAASGTPTNLEDQDDEETTLKGLLDMTNKLKKEYLSATGSAISLIDTIKLGDPNWSWADNPGNVGTVEEKYAELKKAIRPEFHKILALPGSQMKKEFEEEALKHRLGEFNTILLPKVQGLSHQCAVLIARFRAVQTV
jgi:hypothetical protein